MDQTYNFTDAAEQAPSNPSAMKSFFGVGTSPVTGQRRLPAVGRARAVQQAQQEISLQIGQMQMEQARFGMLEKAANMEMQIKTRRGLAHMNHLFMQATGTEAFGSPGFLQEVYRVGSQYGLSDEQLAPYIERAEKANRRREMANMLQSGIQGRTTMTIDKEGNPSYSIAESEVPAPVRTLQEAWKIRERAEQARLAGDAIEYQRLKGMADEMASTVKQHGESISTGFDDQGRPIFRVEKGAPGGGRNPTVGMETSAQRLGVSIEMLNELGNKVRANLRDGDVGPAGVVGELFVDKALGWIDGKYVNQDRVANRTALGVYRETAIKLMQADQTGRFAVADRRAIESLLPSSGVFESRARVDGAIKTIEQIMNARALALARVEGIGSPLFAMDRKSIRALYDSELDILGARVARNEITPEQAVHAGDSLRATFLPAYEKANPDAPKY
jgi:hypothetical protein